MIRNLLLLRHAEAAERLAAQPDFDRPLTERGIQQAVKVGAYLQTNGWYPQLILASPAMRTHTTAQIVADALEYPESDILLEAGLYNGTVLQLFEAIRQVHADFTTVLLVAHNPGISYLGEWLTKVADSTLTPGGLLQIEFELPFWIDLHEGCGQWKRIFQP